MRLAALLHDIGKPATRRLEPGGAVSFHHHDMVGAKLARKRLRALRFDNDTINAVARLIELHLRFFGYTDGAWTDSAVRRYVRDAGDQLERLHILTRADVTTRNRRKADRLGFAYDDLEERIAQLAEEEELAAVRPELDGQQIMAAPRREPGPVVGEAYKFLLDLRLDEGPIGPDAARERLLAWGRARGRTRRLTRPLSPPHSPSRRRVYFRPRPGCNCARRFCTRSRILAGANLPPRPLGARGALDRR